MIEDLGPYVFVFKYHVAMWVAAPSLWCFPIFIQAKMSKFVSLIYSNILPKDIPRENKSCRCITLY